jgi:apolipoprotein N-acyltransferase
MTPGEDSELFCLDSATVGSLICFDSIYETLPLDAVRDGAEIIAVSTNDSWFSDSSGVYMHNNQSRLRAVELGRCVVRSANTGVSSFISSTGAVVSDIGALERGFLCEDVPVLTGRTLYSYVGNIFILFTTAFITAPLLLDAIAKLKNKQKKSTRGYVNNED